MLFFVFLVGCTSEQVNEDEKISQNLQENQDEIIQGNQENIDELMNTIVAKVNGEEINLAQVRTIQQNYQMQGFQISEDDALEQVIDEVIIYQEVDKSGYIITNEDAESMIELQLAQFGSSLSEYKDQLALEGLSYENQLEEVKFGMAVQRYLDEIFESYNFEVTEEDARDFYELYKSQTNEEIPSFEELEQQIIFQLQQEQQEEVINNLIQELRLDVEIEYI